MRFRHSLAIIDPLTLQRHQVSIFSCHFFCLGIKVVSATVAHLGVILVAHLG